VLSSRPAYFIFSLYCGDRRKVNNFCISSLLWNIYIVFSALRKKINTEGDVPPSMSGSCAVCVDRVLYLFGGHHSRGNTNKVSVSQDYGSRQFYSFTDNFRFLRLVHTYSCPSLKNTRTWQWYECAFYFSILSTSLHLGLWQNQLWLITHVQ